MSGVASADIAGSPFTVVGVDIELTPFTVACITDEYLGWLNDGELMRYSRQRFVRHTPETARAYLSQFTRTPSHFWSIRCREDGRALGTVTAHVDSRAAVADVGFLVAERGRGIGRETCGLVLDFLFRHAGARKVTGGTVRANTAMLRIFEGWGMTVEGVQREQDIVEDRLCDVVLFGLLRHEWERRRGGTPSAQIVKGDST